MLETVGTQEYRLERAAALDRFAGVYGGDAAAEVAAHLAGAVPA